MRALRTVKLSTVLILATLQLIVTISIGTLAFAQNTQVYNSLAKSRDALLDQRTYLQSEADKVSQQLDALQQKMERVNGYLRDNDRALRDVEAAMRRAQ
jgi:prefoldin subunit 5